ncbi:MAG: class I SAM-dependent methyltransferase [bacterium]|nr:class I SAM-dependent methyltransferase [bacterium]
MQIADHWKNYELLASGDGEKLERWGDVILRRPDPQIIWPLSHKHPRWDKPDARYERSSSGGGRWKFSKTVPDEWFISYGELRFAVKTMGFKHTGLFPEQAVNWDWMAEKITSAKRPISVLNLFAYTGGATVACAKAGASVCHVDAAKNMVERAKENARLSGLESHPIRYITDDVNKFVEREIRRERQYDAIIMDPPSFGRGPQGEIWKVEDHLFALVELCSKVLSKKPLFFLINSYTTGFSPTVIQDLLKLSIEKRFGGKTSCDELGLPETGTGLVLPCGIFGRWEG